MAEATLIDGKAFAEALRARVGAAAADLKARHGLIPGLATVLVGDDPASHVYVRNKNAQTVAAGMQSFHHPLPATTSQDELLALIAKLNADAAVHGILVQLPLPKQIDSDSVIAAIDPAKDVDGFHLMNVGKLAAGISGGAVPCTPMGCLMLLKDALGDLAGKTAVVVGRSNIVGKPMAHLLLGESCTVTIAHSRTKDLPAVCRQADILVAAVGRPLMIQGDWIKPGAAVIDVGINRVAIDPKEGSEPGKTKLVGDVDFASAVKVAGFITPVPGGVGPMTIACLLRSTLLAACAIQGLAAPAL
jgi:methylenetetrahydrofolate dehydrogenase (NADP+)/methenyltetrahydrofolate cyclohydrolase